MRDAADALGKDASIEVAWLRGAADLVERDEAGRNAVRADALWLEELAPEARARKNAVLSAWVDAAEALRTAIHALESERGPLVESLFPGWRAPSLRRHADQARAAETELQRRLASGYVVRRLAELATHDALGAALEGLAAAGTAWAADRDRPSLEGAEGDAMRTRLLAMAGRTAHLLDRVRWVVRAALADRPELIDAVFPRRTRPAPTAEGSAPGIETVASAPDVPPNRVADGPGTTATDAPPERTSATRPTRRAGTTRTADSSPTDASPSRTTGRSAGKPKSSETSSTSAGSRSARTPRLADAPSIGGTGRATGKADPSGASASSAASRSARKPRPSDTPSIGAPGRAAGKADASGASASGASSRSARKPKPSDTRSIGAPGRATGKEDPSDAPASSTARRSTRKPGSSAAAAPAPQPSARGSRRKPRPPRGS